MLPAVAAAMLLARMQLVQIKNIWDEIFVYICEKNRISPYFVQNTVCRLQ